MGGSACLAHTAAAGQANPRGFKFLLVCFRRSAKISGRPVTKFQQKMAVLIGYQGCFVAPEAARGLKLLDEPSRAGFSVLSPSFGRWNKPPAHEIKISAKKNPRAGPGGCGGYQGAVAGSEKVNEVHPGGCASLLAPLESGNQE